MRAKKSLGQNFLMHARTAARIADAAGLTAGDTVLEIGPGTGMLTRALLARAGKVIAVEADAALVERLRETFAAELADGKLTLVHADIRDCPMNGRPAADRAEGASGALVLPEEYVVVANIPYYLTGEIIRSLLESPHQPRAMTLLVQKEVAERIARAKKESILSLSVKAYGTPRYAFTVPRGAFVPAPKVDSAVLSIRGISRASFGTPAQEQRFFALVRAGFAHKRKLLAGNLAGLVGPAALGAAGIPEKARAEDLALADWLALVRES